MEKTIYFNGYRFCRDEKTNYYLSSIKINGKRKRLHVYTWEYYNGEIEKGFCVHHKDDNKLNNDISNFELMSKSEHRRLHTKKYFKDPANLEKARKNLDEIRKKASEWHGSPEGIEWHKKHHKEYSASLYKKVYLVCEYCGNEYETIDHGKNRFCSVSCKGKQYRKEARESKENRA